MFPVLRMESFEEEHAGDQSRSSADETPIPTRSSAHETAIATQSSGYLNIIPIQPRFWHWQSDIHPALRTKGPDFPKDLAQYQWSEENLGSPLHIKGTPYANKIPIDYPSEYLGQDWKQDGPEVEPDDSISMRRMVQVPTEERQSRFKALFSKKLGPKSKLRVEIGGHGDPEDDGSEEHKLLRRNIVLYWNITRSVK